MDTGRNEFALAIGLSLLRANEIDWMTLKVRTKILGKEISKSWLKKPFKERITGLIANLKLQQEPIHSLIQAFAEAETLCDTRNDLAHGSFVLMPINEPGLTSEFATLKLGPDRSPITVSVAQTHALKWRELSDRISEQIAIFEIQSARFEGG